MNDKDKILFIIVLAAIIVIATISITLSKNRTTTINLQPVSKPNQPSSIWDYK